MNRWLLAVVAAVVLLPTAAAHAVYLESEPAKGARLDTAPTEAWVRLTEPVDPGTFSFEVVDLQGNKVSTGEPSLVPGPQALLSSALRPDLGEGAYLMRWQVLSTADGHVTSGSTGFAVGNAQPPAGETDGEDTQTSLLAPWARFASFIGLCIAAGALLFARLGRGIAWAVHGLPLLLFIGAAVNVLGVALLFVDTVRQSGLALEQVAQTQVGTVLSVRLIASAVAMAAAVLLARTANPRAPTTVAVAALLVAGAGSARLGHASLAGPSAILVDLMHLATVAIWVGGLFVYWSILLRAMRQDAPEDDVRRLGLAFGPVALTCVIALTVTGLATTWTILHDYVPTDLLTSAWGRFLAVKVALFAVMLLAAAANRYVLLGTPSRWTRPFTNYVGQVGAAGQRLRRLVQVEAIFGVGTLFLAALLTSISPPSAAMASPTVERVEVESTGMYYGFFGHWDQQPAAGQSTTLTIQILNHHEGNVIENNTCGRDSCVQLELTPPDGSGVQVYTLRPTEGKRWTTEPVLWVGAGFYQAVLKLQTEHVYLDEMPFDVRVESA